MRLLALVIIPLTFAATAYGFGAGANGCSGDCTACHSVKKDEVIAIMKDLDAGTKVESVGPSPVPGLYQVVVKNGPDTGIVYLDFSKKFIIVGRAIDTRYKKDVTNESLAEIRRIDPAALPMGNALMLGNSKGTKKLYVFTDPQCPYCAKLHEELVSLTREDPQLGVYILITPLDIHPEAAVATDTIICASKKNMADGVRLLEESLGGKKIELNGCGVNYGEAGKAVGKSFGINLTPTLVLQNGKVIPGARSKEEIKKLLAESEEKS